MSGTRRPDHTAPLPAREAWTPKTAASPLLGVEAMTPWTTREIEIMREQGHRGVAAVQEAIRRECGTFRSVRSIESQASRCHVSLKVQTVCPECGLVGVKLNRQSGMCRRCTEKMHLAEEISFNELLQREREEAAGGADADEIARERAAMRQRNSRLCRKYGLPSRRDRLGGK